MKGRSPREKFEGSAGQERSKNVHTVPHSCPPKADFPTLTGEVPLDEESCKPLGTMTTETDWNMQIYYNIKKSSADKNLPPNDPKAEDNGNITLNTELNSIKCLRIHNPTLNQKFQRQKQNRVEIGRDERRVDLRKEKEEEDKMISEMKNELQGAQGERFAWIFNKEHWRKEGRLPKEWKWCTEKSKKAQRESSWKAREANKNQHT